MQVEIEHVPQYTLLLDREDMVTLRRIVREAVGYDIGPEEVNWGRNFLHVTERLMG